MTPLAVPDLSGETRITWQEHLIFGADRIADRLWHTPPQPLFASAVHAVGVAAVIVLVLVITYRLAAWSSARPIKIDSVRAVTPLPQPTADAESEAA